MNWENLFAMTDTFWTKMDTFWTILRFNWEGCYMRLNWDGIFAVLSLFLMVVFVGCGGDVTKDSPKKITWEKDGAEMVLIPESFTRTKDTYDKVGDLVPGEVVKVTDYLYMDMTEVTVGQFKTFLKSSGYEPEKPIDWEELYEYSPTSDYPMIYVTWHDATAYAKWAGKRLPTEAEWEFAARGGLVGKEYVWGDDKAVVWDYANCDGKDKWEYCAPVGSFKPNGYGLFDMSGNVWEWCQDWRDSNTKVCRVLRGGSWGNYPFDLRAALRSLYCPTNTYNNYGFRCVSGFRTAGPFTLVRAMHGLYCFTTCWC